MKMQTQFISNHTSASTSLVSRSATPIEQQKMNEAQGLKDQAENFMHNDLFLIINK